MCTPGAFVAIITPAEPRLGASVLEEENIKSSKYTCRYLRDEPVNGEPAAVYSTHSERDDFGIKSDGEIWISKSRGLPLRQELEIMESGDKPEVNHHSMRYEYTNVQPPAL